MCRPIRPGAAIRADCLPSSSTTHHLAHTGHWPRSVASRTPSLPAMTARALTTTASAAAAADANEDQHDEWCLDGSQPYGAQSPSEPAGLGGTGPDGGNSPAHRVNRPHDRSTRPIGIRCMFGSVCAASLRDTVMVVSTRPEGDLASTTQGSAGSPEGASPGPNPPAGKTPSGWPLTTSVTSRVVPLLTWRAIVARAVATGLIAGGRAHPATTRRSAAASSRLTLPPLVMARSRLACPGREPVPRAEGRPRCRVDRRKGRSVAPVPRSMSRPHSGRRAGAVGQQRSSTPGLGHWVNAPRRSRATTASPPARCLRPPWPYRDRRCLRPCR